ncbi:MAG: hypothetical protein JST85_09280 [Acidobacteria bacterium]|nr:hypothetical protein [Acidobacteriota bacterium]
MDKVYYHRQNKEEDCGPASVQIVLNYLDDNLPAVGKFDQQSKLKSNANLSSHNAPWDWNRYNNWKWQPDEIRGMLAKYLNSSASAEIYPTISASGKVYSVDPITGKSGYKSKLSDHLNQSKYPIVPIHGTFHYNDKLVPPSIYSDIVENLLLNNDGKIEDSKYIGHWIVLTENQNDSFIGFDPWLPKLLGAPEISSTHTKSVAGKGGTDCACFEVYIHVSGDKDALGLNFPAESRVAIVWNVSNSTGRRVPPTKTGNLPQFPQTGKCINKPFDAQSLFDQMTAFGLRKQPPCNVYLEKSTIVAPNVKPKFNLGMPRLVRRLDAFCNDYYLVPFLKLNRPGETAPGASTILARVDAPSLLYLDALFYSENPLLIDETTIPMPPPLPAILTQKDIINRYVPDQLIKKGKRHWIKPFQDQIKDISNPPEMVWLPCKQSISPFFPFFVITAGSEKFLVRLDGAVFEKLSY